MTMIRNYQASDWMLVSDWWAQSGEIGPLPTMMPIDSSFVAEVHGKPALAVAVYLTNSPEIAYCENFIGNPEFRGSERRLAAQHLSEHVANFVRGRGYKRLICMTEKPVLMGRYKELGFSPTLSGVTTLVRVL